MDRFFENKKPPKEAEVIDRVVCLPSGGDLDAQVVFGIHHLLEVEVIFLVILNEEAAVRFEQTAYLGGQFLFLVDPADLEERIAEHDDIERAWIKVVLRGGLDIQTRHHHGRVLVLKERSVRRGANVERVSVGIIRAHMKPRGGGKREDGFHY